MVEMEARGERKEKRGNEASRMYVRYVKYAGGGTRAHANPLILVALLLYFMLLFRYLRTYTHQSTEHSEQMEYTVVVVVVVVVVVPVVVVALTCKEGFQNLIQLSLIHI